MERTSAAASRVRAKNRASETAYTISANQVFAWAQMEYPALFGVRPPVVIKDLAYEGKIFDVRAYETGNYLGVANNEAFGYGPFTNYQLVSFGAISQYTSRVCIALSCEPGDGTGPLNECAAPADQALASGHSYRLAYQNTGAAAAGESTVEAEVGAGSSEFAGVSAVHTRITSTITETTVLAGVPRVRTTTIQTSTYSQAAERGLTRTIGAEVTSTSSGLAPGFPPLTTRSTVTYSPANLNTEFTLRPGGSLSKSTGSTTVTTFPPPTSTVVDKTEATHTFEGLETLTVLAGTYPTCRYLQTGADGSTRRYWFLIGKGVLIRSEAVTPSGIEATELVSGEWNGNLL